MPLYTNTYLRDCRPEGTRSRSTSSIALRTCSLRMLFGIMAATLSRAPRSVKKWLMIDENRRPPCAPGSLKCSSVLGLAGLVQKPRQLLAAAGLLELTEGLGLDLAEQAVDTQTHTSNTPQRSAGSARDGSPVLSAQRLDDVLGQVLFDLAMPRDWLRKTGRRVAIPVVLGAAPNQHAPKALDGSDQVHALHGTMSSSTLRIPGI